MHQLAFWSGGLLLLLNLFQHGNPNQQKLFFLGDTAIYERSGKHSKPLTCSPEGLY